MGTVSVALQAALKGHASLPGAVVERDEFVNVEPNLAAAGWIGIYKIEAVYDPLTLASGYAGRYNVTPKLMLVLQRTAPTGAQCSDALEAMIAIIIGILIGGQADVGGTVEQIKSMRIGYEYDPRSNKEEGVYFQSAYMLLELEVANG